MISRNEAELRWGYRALIKEICRTLPAATKELYQRVGVKEYRRTITVYDPKLLKAKLDEILNGRKTDRLQT